MRFTDEQRAEIAERFNRRDIKEELRHASEYQLTGYNRIADAEFKCWLAMTALAKIEELEEKLHAGDLRKDG